MHIKMEIMDACKIAYIRRVGAYGLENKRQMEQIKEWAKTHDLLNDEAIILGMAQDDPSYVKPELCRYDTCIVIAEGYKVEENEVQIGKVIGGKYMIFEVAHTVEAIGEAWKNIFGEIVQQGYRLDASRPIIERYQMKMIKNHLCEICVPID